MTNANHTNCGVFEKLLCKYDKYNNITLFFSAFATRRKKTFLFSYLRIAFSDISSTPFASLKVECSCGPLVIRNLAG